MNTLRTQISEDIKNAMRAHDAMLLETLRYLFAMIKNVEIDTKHELSDEEILKVIQKEVKNRKDAIAQFQAGGRTDLVTAEQEKLNVLTKFLPEQMSQEAVEAEVKAIVDALPSKELPLAMREVMGKLKGKADGKMLADAVKKLVVG